MSRRIFYNLLLAAAVLLTAQTTADAQAYGSYTPYSIFGVGDLQSGGTAYNKSMGGVGIASRNHRFLNPLNPAAVTARDSLAFMADFSLYEDNKVFKQGDMKSASNTFNIGDLILSFPIYRSSAVMVGITPYSDTGYDYGYYYTDPNIIGNTGNIAYTASGSGSLYQGFLGAGVTFWDRISIGAEALLNFGKVTKEYYETFTESSYNGANNGFNMQLISWGGKFGLQYEQPLGNKAKLGFGATYRLASKLNGNVEAYRYSTGTAATDTLYYKSGKPENLKLASEKGAGISFSYADRLFMEFDYTRSDWTNTGIGTADGFMGNSTPGTEVSAFTTSIGENYRFGVEYVPNRDDIRYYMKTVSYRAGAYYRKEYYKVDGQNVNDIGFTLGATFPVFRWYNGLTLAVNFGQRGTVANNLVRERYVNFSVGFNLFDIWFQKHFYE